MTEKDIKDLCKYMVDNSNRPLKENEKELLKQAINNAKTMQEMIFAIATIINIFESNM